MEEAEKVEVEVVLGNDFVHFKCQILVLYSNED